MKNTIFKTVISLCAAMLVLIPVSAEVGDSDDPVVSKSYIDTYIAPQLSYEVVSVEAGQSVICGAGCELILRMGDATVIATEKGGLADVTSGVDLADGSAMPSNHLLIVPLADGRGISANTDLLVMIKGNYTIS